MLRFVVLSLLFVQAGACNRTAPAIDPTQFPVMRITDRVYVIHGANDLPSPANKGFINNPGFVLTKKGVVVIDPGSSLQIGEVVLKAIAGVTPDPVVAVFNTHIHGDHWLGNDAIHRAYPKAVIYAHPAMMRDAPAVGEIWLSLFSSATDQAIRGTNLVMPTLGVDHDETLALGGLHFRALHNGPAHTDGDIMIEVIEDKVLFTGDNIVQGRAGRFDEANITGQIAACDLALATPAQHVVPGHGRSGGRELITQQREWLTRLYSATKRLYQEHVSEAEFNQRMLVELKDYRRWNNFDKDIGKILSLTWLQVEKEAF